MLYNLNILTNLCITEFSISLILNALIKCIIVINWELQYTSTTIFIINIGLNILNIDITSN